MDGVGKTAGEAQIARGSRREERDDVDADGDPDANKSAALLRKAFFFFTFFRSSGRFVKLNYYL